MSRLPVILNPTAGGGRLLRHIQRLESVAVSAGAEIEVLYTKSGEHTTELAADEAVRGTPLVLAFGGDGTYNAVARGLLGSTTAMGVLPGGTTSVLAYEFDIPRPAHRAVEALIEGEDRAMCVGRTSAGDLVLLMLSAGPDAHVLERLNPRFKRLGGRVGVALQAVVEAVGGGPLPKMRVIGEEMSLDAGWVIVGKSRCYAGKYCATPGADPFRDDFEIVAQKDSGRRAAVSFLLALPSGRHVERDDVARQLVTSVRIEPASPGAKVPYQIDGDVVGELPVEIALDPRQLIIRLPKA